ncbi:pilus assembly PilX N-terminal domain-containing protein [Bacillus sp. OK048]|uniref:pilus assembly PilX N-terminal domain-containing protein n=1 Tax=Bacillus sp. OK048 TaxID=1882761 RepID=UPI00087F42DC|nr:pilus assembly PilX N-terminal domain-containing protein [Bacillus sp. OK048]SDM23722.1 PilX N-terminal [Bacillus sp. OK048]
MKLLGLEINKLKNESGMALITVLLVLVVMSVMGLSLMGMAASNVKMSSGERSTQSSYYIAESGVTYIMNDITKNIEGFYKDSSDQTSFFSKFESNYKVNTNNLPNYDQFEATFGQQKPVSNIRIDRLDNNPNSAITREYKITSIGAIDKRSRTVEKQFQLTWKPKDSLSIPDTAVFTKNTIKLVGGGGIVGGLGTNLNTAGSIELDGGPTISGNIYVGPTAVKKNVLKKPDSMIVNNPIINMQSIKTFNMPVFPTFPSYPIPADKSHNEYKVINKGVLRVDSWQVEDYVLDMDSNMSFSEIRLNSNYRLFINVKDSDKSIVVDHLNVTNGKIYIIGKGKLTIYVRNNITMGSGSLINSSDQIVNPPKKASADEKRRLIEEQVKKLEVFYKGTKPFILAGDQKIYGSLFAESAELIFSGGGGFQGHIVSGGNKVTIKGGAEAITQLFYAPNADFIASEGGTITGTIIANSFSGSGGSKVTFPDTGLNQDTVPSFIEIGSGGSVNPKDIIISAPTREK